MKIVEAFTNEICNNGAQTENNHVIWLQGTFQSGTLCYYPIGPIGSTIRYGQLGRVEYIYSKAEELGIESFKPIIKDGPFQTQSSGYSRYIKMIIILV